MGFRWFKREKVLKQTDLLVRQQAIGLANLLRIQAITSERSGVEPDSDRNIVVSLTTYGRRLEDVYLCIESLLQQSLRPNRLLLWLSEEEFPAGTVLPAMLHNQMSRGLEVRYCRHDWGSYKKIIPTLELCPDALIVTVDDDVMYPVDTLDLLYRTHLKYPSAVVAHRAHEVILDRHGNVMPYKKWPKGVRTASPSNAVFPVGIGGVLYIPGCFSPEVMQSADFMALCPQADDIWLKVMALRAGTKAVVVQDSRPWLKRYLFIEGSQDVTLTQINKCPHQGNDLKMARVLARYAIEGRCFFTESTEQTA